MGSRESLFPGSAVSESQLSLLGLASSCQIGTPDTAARVIVDRSLSGFGGYVCLCNVHVLTLALHDATVSEALHGAWQRLPDGAPVAWLQRRLGHPDARRIGGPDLMPRVVDIGRDAGLRHFLFGSTPEVTSRVERALLERYSGAEIVGMHSPPVSAGGTVESDSLAVITAARADVVWCALGAPKQELWMHRAAPQLPGALLLGVGAAFDFLADTKRRAPSWMHNRGLEWSHRLASEPARLGGRYLKTNTEFVVRASFELTRHRLRT